MGELIPEEVIEKRIFLIRGNKERFPEEFMFQLMASEKDELVTNWHRFESMKHSSALPLLKHL